MVIWLFAGGGEAEIGGLHIFFKRNFPNCIVKRMTPVRPKAGPRPGNRIEALGRTGASLRRQIRYRLEKTPDFDECDLLLVLDDLDCRPAEQERNRFNQVFDASGKVDGIPRVIAFAAPEVESWFIADWANTFETDMDFRGAHQWLRHALSTNHGVSYQTPESFSAYDPEKDCCQEKLSEEIMSAVIGGITRPDVQLDREYKKGYHSARMLRRVSAVTVAAKCPLFRDMYIRLNAECDQ